ncbi:YggS family pyridoxal phosphate-dependent enzyme [Ravibacter arvi]|uniref:Pyridoxal phosphate homeostasis protein n=1 Tax=Ravibacter arvi TaxID=2051041 RepID=A0ABP8M1Q6_9BACT
MQDIVHNLDVIHQRMKNACLQSGRPEDAVRLLLATKTVSEENLRFAVGQGEVLLGENRVQDGSRMAEKIKDLPVEWHFIGHLQTNKIKEVLRWATCIQSVDRTDLVEKLDQRLQFEQRKTDVFVQVNTSYEPSKFGVEPEKALDLIREVMRYDTLNLKGLMTIGLFSAEAERVRKCFQVLAGIRNQALELGFEHLELSMGMSGDLEIAIEEGATIIRVGTAIFGPRVYPDSFYWNEGSVKPTGNSS